MVWLSFRYKNQHKSRLQAKVFCSEPAKHGICICLLAKRRTNDEVLIKICFIVHQALHIIERQIPKEGQHMPIFIQMNGAHSMGYSDSACRHCEILTPLTFQQDGQMERGRKFYISVFCFNAVELPQTIQFTQFILLLLLISLIGIISYVTRKNF